MRSREKDGDKASLRSQVPENVGNHCEEGPKGVLYCILAGNGTSGASELQRGSLQAEKARLRGASGAGGLLVHFQNWAWSLKKCADPH